MTPPSEGRTLIERLQFSYNEHLEFIPLYAIIKESYAIAGKRTNKDIRDVQRLVAAYDKDPSEWKKMVGKVTSKKNQFDIHWYECGDEVVRAPKIKCMKEIKKKKG